MKYWNNITAIFNKQAAKGLAEYGQPIEENQLPDAIERISYIEEELVDGLIYCEWLKDSIRQIMSRNEDDMK